MQKLFDKLGISDTVSRDPSGLDVDMGWGLGLGTAAAYVQYVA